MTELTIRLGCLRPATNGWEQPTSDTVSEVLKLAGFTGGQAAKSLGLGSKRGCIWKEN